MKSAAAAFLAAAGLAVCSAAGSLTGSAAPSIVNTATGVEVIFNGSITNGSSTDRIYLNDVQIAQSGGPSGHVALHANPFFANVPGILLPGESYTGPLLGVILDPSAPAADYTAVATLRGGPDQTAADILLNLNLALLSPALTVTASTPDASEFGPTQGSFTIARTGRTDLDLTVAFSASGSARPGADYVALSGPFTIPAGASTLSLAALPIPNDVVDGDRSLVLNLSASTSYNLAVPAAATVTVHDKPVDQWRAAHFAAAANSPAAADSADWDHDGIPNLLEYALGSDPVRSNAADLPASGIANGFLTLSFVPDSSVADALLSVEASTDLKNWSTNDVVPVTVANPVPPSRLTFRYRYPTGSGRAFLRLKASRTAP